MPKFTRASDLEKHLKKALDATLYETIRSTQGSLGSEAVSPKDTGRFLSSWFSQEGSPSSEVAPEDANSPNIDATSLKVDSDKTYHLTNSLEYAQSAAIEGRVVSKGPNWFHDFRNVGIPKIMEQSANAAKEKYDL